MVRDERLVVLSVLTRGVLIATLSHGAGTGILGVKVALMRLTLQNFSRSRYLYALQERFLVLCLLCHVLLFS